ncbi:hypothetical protein O181_029785 [Austropuccinia psidii MF-1]|uniref:Methyltransferase type 11 domain-containing protein n=1 Tax=Austropuccinia psidii MF-1 TaxID=1389203 RepID=A0A9Q3CVV9_9BASI|nr:hypothetical protein [Austropuccinia psidii MF-1]
MAETFATKSYPVEKYASFRPTYPPELYQAILDYHQGDKNFAIDLGCGTGIVTTELVRQAEFSYVVGVDPSEAMLDYAKKTSPNAQFVHGRAESLPWVADKSVDLITAGTAAHWFEPAWWKEAERILKPNGTVAVFIYGGLWPDPSHPKADLLRQTMFSFANELGFSSTGNLICHEMYDGLPLPGGGYPTKLAQHKRIDWNRQGLGDRLVMADQMSLRTWRERVYTYGPAHRWRIENPSKVGNKHFDPIEKTIESLKLILEIKDDDDEEKKFLCGHSLSILLFRYENN